MSPPPYLLSLLPSHQAISNKDQHSISYTLSRAQTVVVEYTHDSNTDMFQVTSLSFYHRDWSFTTSPYLFHWNNLLISAPGLRSVVHDCSLGPKQNVNEDIFNAL